MLTADIRRVLLSITISTHLRKTRQHQRNNESSSRVESETRLQRSGLCNSLVPPPLLLLVVLLLSHLCRARARDDKRNGEQSQNTHLSLEDFPRRKTDFIVNYMPMTILPRSALYRQVNVWALLLPWGSVAQSIREISRSAITPRGGYRNFDLPHGQVSRI